MGRSKESSTEVGSDIDGRAAKVVGLLSGWVDIVVVKSLRLNACITRTRRARVEPRGKPAGKPAGKLVGNGLGA